MRKFTSLYPQKPNFVDILVKPSLSFITGINNICHAAKLGGQPEQIYGYYRVFSRKKNGYFVKVLPLDKRDEVISITNSEKLFSEAGMQNLAPLSIWDNTDYNSVSVCYPYIEHRYFDGALEDVQKIMNDIVKMSNIFRDLVCKDRPSYFAQIKHALFTHSLEVKYSQKQMDCILLDDYFTKEDTFCAHNDIHCGNILLSGDAPNKIIDFEESVKFASHPLVDVCAFIERFVLPFGFSYSKSSEILSCVMGGIHHIRPASMPLLIALGRMRCHYALCLIEQNKTNSNAHELEKFKTLLRHWENLDVTE